VKARARRAKVRVD